MKRGGDGIIALSQKGLGERGPEEVTQGKTALRRRNRGLYFR